MSIAVTCPDCNRVFKVPDNAAGKKRHCPKCDAATVVPDPDAEDDIPPERSVKRPGKIRARKVEEDDGHDAQDETTGSANSRRTLYLAIGGGGVLLVMLTLVAILAFGGGGKKSDPSGSGSVSASSDFKESQVKDVLKTLLDAWVFGDIRDFEKSHPDIERPLMFGKLLRYEIGISRKTAKGHEFAVILVFESKAGTEIKKGCTCNVYMNDFQKKWNITGIELPDP